MKDYSLKYDMRLVYLFLFFSMSTIFAQKSTHPIDIKNKQCHENAIPTTKAAMNCENEALISWNNEMKNYLELLKKKNKQIDIVLLEKSQKKWSDFYKTDVALQYSYLDRLYDGGTMSRIVKWTYRKEEVRKRALKLKHLFENLE
ncbi:lysozyme inhibitor LprI family protein [Polaribacter uvawellassae]|uniref:lysozyme inhibitor LprI family protein n=1 Tax=Polaribacter uvawellassae TaxID=3133495 RepID=UPI00321C3B55